jgi:hypothetical protein
LLLGLCAATVHTVLRTSARLRVARWPAPRIAGLAGAAALPWLVVWLAPIKVVVNIHGVVSLVGWLLLALLAFALLVLLPLAAVLSVVVWWRARHRRSGFIPPVI